MGNQESLSKEAGIALLQMLEVKGSQDEMAGLVAEVRGHALTLQIIGGYLKKAHAGDIRKKEQIELHKADDRTTNGHAFRAMQAYETWLEQAGKEGQQELAILRIMGLFDRPADVGCFNALIQASVIAGLTEPLSTMDEPELNCCLDELEQSKLITINRDNATGELVNLDAHPLIREYFAEQLEKTKPDAFQQAHQRIFEHLCESTHESEQPTLDELLPLYQAIGHGCKAGMHEIARAAVFRDRIYKGTDHDGFYSHKKLGAIGMDLSAVACFFDQPWQAVSANLDKTNQAWVISVAAFYLQILGRLTEALQPMQVSLDMGIAEEDWNNTAIRADNLTELLRTLGKLPEAVKQGQLAIDYADKSEIDIQKFLRRTTLANAMRQSGQINEAANYFRQAEALQAEYSLQFPQLYSLRGFYYSDLLLHPVEIAAAALKPQAIASNLQTAISEVKKRVKNWFNWRQPNISLLDIALAHLSAGRIALYQHILAEPIDPETTTELQHIEQAMTYLRQSGSQHRLPLALLTRAWKRAAIHHNYTGSDSAQTDLDEAWEIAERGPMRLYMADIHLYRARLFYKLDDYPWQSPEHDLGEARRLIEECGYWRRKEELEDAEAGV